MKREKKRNQIFEGKLNVVKIIGLSFIQGMHLDFITYRRIAIHSKSGQDQQVVILCLLRK